MFAYLNSVVFAIDLSIGMIETAKYKTQIQGFTIGDVESVALESRFY
jgi:hypothetical protein